jgi:hypothetical protein
VFADKASKTGNGGANGRSRKATAHRSASTAKDTRDAYEAEADQAADKLSLGPEAKGLQLKSLGSAAVPEHAPAEVRDTLRRPGQPLDAQARKFFEPRFGFDFSKVRIHSDDKASESALSLGARAFTSGRDIVFGAGEYQGGSNRRLLAHELTHVVQQSTRGAAPLQRKEVAGDANIRGKQDWTEADREGETSRWSDACKTNLDAVDSSQYLRVVERRDFYKWFYHYAARRGFTTRWALAAYVVANGAHQIADMDASHSFSNSLLSMANVELEGAMREGNQIIFDNVLPKLKKLIDGGPLTGPAALKWDSQVLAEEQALVQPMYKLLSPESIEQMEYIARKKRFAGLGAWVTGGDKVEGDQYVEGGKVPAFDDNRDLKSVGDRWKYGMELGDKFTPGGSGYDPTRDKMPAVAAGYTDGSELAKVDTRKHLHELDAWLNPDRDDRVGPGSDYKAIIAGLTENEKKLVLQDRSPDGWAYSTSFAQFGFIDEATVKAALPSDPALAAPVAAFVARFNAEQTRVNMRYPTGMMVGF